MTYINYRAANAYDVKAASDEAVIDPATYGPSLTVQSMAEETDLNVIMKRFGITGKMPENPRIPSYGDFTGISDFRSALHAVMEAEEGFMQIPADVRARFQNDPQQFLEFCSQETNREEMRKMGLLKTDVGPGGPNGGTPGTGVPTPPTQGAKAPETPQGGKTT